VSMPATDKRITTIAQLIALPDDGMRHEYWSAADQRGNQLIDAADHYPR